MSRVPGVSIDFSIQSQSIAADGAKLKQDIARIKADIEKNPINVPVRAGGGTPVGLNPGRLYGRSATEQATRDMQAAAVQSMRQQIREANNLAAQTRVVAEAENRLAKNLGLTSAAQDRAAAASRRNASALRDVGRAATRAGDDMGRMAIRASMVGVVARMISGGAELATINRDAKAAAARGDFSGEVAAEERRNSLAASISFGAGPKIREFFTGEQGQIDATKFETQEQEKKSARNADKIANQNTERARRAQAQQDQHAAAEAERERFARATSDVLADKRRQRDEESGLRAGRMRAAGDDVGAGREDVIRGAERQREEILDEINVQQNAGHTFRARMLADELAKVEEIGHARIQNYDEEHARIARNKAEQEAADAARLKASEDVEQAEENLSNARQAAGFRAQADVQGLRNRGLNRMADMRELQHEIDSNIVNADSPEAAAAARYLGLAQLEAAGKGRGISGFSDAAGRSRAIQEAILAGGGERDQDAMRVMKMNLMRGGLAGGPNSPESKLGDLADAMREAVQAFEIVGVVRRA